MFGIVNSLVYLCRNIRYMNERLLKIMEHFNYSPSIFADEIGVIRSSISHIISGRNNPGLELLQKVLIRFPQISSDWLLLGRGEMLLNENELETKMVTNVNYPKKIGQLNLDDITSAQPAKTTIPGTYVNRNPEAIPQNIPEPRQEIAEQPKQTEPKEQKIVPEVKAAKREAGVKRVTIYFEDNSFRDFVEEKA